MKVNPTFTAPLMPTDAKKLASPAATSFSRLLAVKKTKQDENVLDSLLLELDNCGSQLTERKTMATFYQYKQAVRQLLDELSRQTYEVTEQTSYRTGAEQQIVRVVDKKLAELYQKLLSDEAHQLELLSLIGELKGILIDRRG